MNALQASFAAASPTGESHRSVFSADKPTQPLVKEVVRFQPAPDHYLALERAGRRAAEGRSVFQDTVIAGHQD